MASLEEKCHIIRNFRYRKREVIHKEVREYPDKRTASSSTTETIESLFWFQRLSVNKTAVEFLSVTL